MTQARARANSQVTTRTLSPFPLGRPARLAVFASGRGSNLDAILHAYPTSHPLAAVALVMGNKATAAALVKAQALGIATCTQPFPPLAKDRDGSARQAFEDMAQAKLEQYQIDLICLAGFMRIFSPDFIARWQGRILNIHPSLLPDFKGLHPQRQALAAGVTSSGCTVHFVEAGVDTGASIHQRSVPVLEQDSEDSLAARILDQEHLAYPEAIALVLTGQVKYKA